MTVPAALPDLGAYRRFVVAFSGGKDGFAALLHFLSLGVPAHAIELHHHDVDGQGPTFMDWPCTSGYVHTIGEHLGVLLDRSCGSDAVGSSGQARPGHYLNECWSARDAAPLSQRGRHCP